MSLEYRGNCRVVLLDKDSNPVGCGFICGPLQVMTCTHVVRSALLDSPALIAPNAVVAVGFPNDRNHRALMRVVTSYPLDGGLLSDIALLELCPDEQFPDDFRIASSRLASVDRSLEIAGVGASADYADVQIIGPTGQYSGLNRVFVLASGGEKEVAFKKGCSGTPVYNDKVGLVGMAAERQADHTGFIIPIQLLRHVWRLADTIGETAKPIETIDGDSYRPSYAGPPFQHDVFVSYARDEPSPELAQRIAKTMLDIEGMVHRADAVGTAFCSSARTSDTVPVGEADRAAIRASALLLIFLSPAYLSGAACLAELDFFFEQAKRDGRTAAHAIVCVMGPTPSERSIPWPDALMEGGRPIKSARILYSQLDEYKALRGEIESLVGEIRTKLKALRNQIIATTPAAPAKHGSLADFPAQLYLQSHPDPAAWQQAKDALVGENFVVAPEPMVQETSDIALQIQQDNERLRMLNMADGYVLIRMTPDDPTSLQASLGLGAMRRVSKGGHRLGWVLLNWVDDNGPTLPPNMPLTCVSALAPNWRDLVRDELGLS